MAKYILLVLVCSFTTKAQTFILNSAVLKSHQTDKAKNAQAMLVAAFASLDITVEFRYRPDKRSIVEANSGQVDGEFARIPSIVNDYPNLIVVPVSLADLDVVAFTAKPTIDLSGYIIGEQQYRIGYLSGWKNVRDLLANYPNKKEIGEYTTLFRLLIRQRVDLVFFTQTAGEKILRATPNIPYSKSSSLLAYSVYLVLHKKHAQLVPKLAASLQRVQKGYLTNYRNQ